MGIIHGEAGYLPDFLDYFSTKFPSAPVKMEILGKKDIETTTMTNFYSQVSRITITHTHAYTHTHTHTKEDKCHAAVKVMYLRKWIYSFCLFRFGAVDAESTEQMVSFQTLKVIIKKKWSEGPTASKPLIFGPLCII